MNFTTLETTDSPFHFFSAQRHSGIATASAAEAARVDNVQRFEYGPLHVAGWHSRKSIAYSTQQPVTCLEILYVDLPLTIQI